MLKALGWAAVLTTGLVTGALAQTTPRVEAGVLTCRVAGGAGFVFGSTKDLTCTFEHQGKRESYGGSITKFGIDVGVTNVATLSWAVLTTTTALPRSALAGNYAGVSGEATVGVGIGANALVGGSSSSIVLQPLSVQSQQGLNIAAGIASLTLHAR
jgi:hypothetical protein